MKVLLIAGASLRLCPYAFLYINEFLKAGVDVTAYVWIRDGLPDIETDKSVHVIHYEEQLDDAAPKKRKLISFIKFRNRLVRHIKNNNYDFIIVLDTQFAVLISDILIKKFSNRFIYDMRDPSYEKYSFYRKCVAAIVTASAGVFISSDGYRQFLPDTNKIYTTHNIRLEDLEYKGIRNGADRKVTPIRISFWGCIRDRDINERLIKALANDDRFMLQYFGTMNADSVQLKKYCENNGINNVVFGGEYSPHERVGFAMNTEIIHNVYSNQYDGKNPCMGNKYYDGLIYKIPQICFTGSLMGTLVSHYKVGLEIQFDDNLKDNIISYYNSVDWDAFNSDCDKALNDILIDFNISQKAIEKIIKEIPKTN